MGPRDQSPEPEILGVGSIGVAEVPKLSAGRMALLLAGLVLVAFNLRPALSSVSPLLGEIRETMGLTASDAGLLTMLPLLCFGLFGLGAPRLSARFGTNPVIVGLLGAIAVGIAVRSIGSVSLLFSGTVIAGAAIGMLNVLLPGLLKRDFPKRLGAAMGLYTMAMCVGAAIGAGLTAPIERLIGAGWQPALAVWLIPPVIAAVVWLPQVRAGRGGATGPRRRSSRLWGQRLAWQVTAFMGLQSALFYSVLGWLPTILQDRGATTVESGWVLSASVLAQIGTSLFVPVLAARWPRQRAIAVATMVASIVGLFGCMFAPLDGVYAWAVLLGFGQGAAFAVALMIVVLRSPDAAVAAQLSGMSQSFGYTLAALGPLAAGAIHSWTGGWTAVAVLFFLNAAAAVAAGLGAGRDRIIDVA